MKTAYFVAPLMGKEKYAESYLKISAILKDLGFEVWDDINNANPSKEWDRTEDQIKEYFNEVQKKIKSCDIFVAEASYPSASIGYEVGYAVGNSKPVLVLFQDTVPGVGIPFKANPSKLLTSTIYNATNLRRKIKGFIKKAEKGIFVKRLPIEFTQDQVSYVEYRQQEGVKRISFNASVRKIVNESIEKDHAYVSQLVETSEEDLD